MCQAIKHDAGKKTDCEQGIKCFPGIEEKNVEAWEIFQMVLIDENGVTPSGIKAVCDILAPADPAEVFLKISEYVKALKASMNEIAGNK